MESKKRSRYKPLKTEEAWDRLLIASENLKVLGRLSDSEAQRCLEAVETLKMVQPSGKLKCYKEFLYDVTRNSRPFVLLCAIALGQVKAVDMTNGDRLGLMGKIKASKDNTDINHSTVRSLAIQYHIPDSVTDLPPLLHTADERLRKSATPSTASSFRQSQPLTKPCCLDIH
ncbi:hypothetical protein AJ79_10141 [Helicocarpus griseus UAMH5409]|uniref:Uncharacterized protein n=1 Tax=Helicocarpus griseus UAMH5409 TaxID=1447875 RepID=A0A2B7WF20_9EURO|nr:hypothetical protein AJ79_10141 [Helicocarpus griseus UAMH5409]